MLLRLLLLVQLLETPVFQNCASRFRSAMAAAATAVATSGIETASLQRQWLLLLLNWPVSQRCYCVYRLPMTALMSMW